MQHLNTNVVVASGLVQESTSTINTAVPGRNHDVSGNPVRGNGGLAERVIRIGDGRQRDTAVSALKALSHVGVQACAIVKMGTKGIALFALSPVGLIVVIASKIITFLPKLVNEKLLEPTAARRFEMANKAVLDKLSAVPMRGGLFRSEKGAAISQQGQDILNRLEAHAKSMGSPLSRDEIQKLALIGERIADALTTNPQDFGKSNKSGIVIQNHALTVQINGESRTIPSNAFTARALAWHMMAVAAKNDIKQVPGKPSNMATNGSFVMKDPDNRIFHFLNANPMVGGRFSTHFEERVAPDGNRVLNKPIQRGFDDYENKLPGQGGALLFDKLIPTERGGDPELFIKIEATGCPALFKLQSHEHRFHVIFRCFAAIDRHVMHSLSFIQTRFEKHNLNEVLRQEHVYKGALKKPVMEPFSLLVNQAVQAGVIDTNLKAIGKNVQKYGLPFINNAVSLIKQYSKELNNTDILHRAKQLENVIKKEVGKFGDPSKQRGAEVRLNLTSHHLKQD